MTMASSIDMSRMNGVKEEPFDMESSFNGARCDTENLPSPSHLIDAPDADYWFGKKFFEGILAQEVFFHSAMDDSIPSMDSRFERMIRNFPLREAINTVQTGIARLFGAGYLSVGTDDYNMLLSLAGTTMRLGTVQEKKFFLTTLRKLAGTRKDVSEGSTPPPTRVNMSSAAPPRSSPPNIVANAETDSEMARYTQMLHARMANRGWNLVWNVDPCPENPQTFKAIVTFQGCSFSGIGRGKQMAKHQASKEAWTFLQGQQEHLD